MDFLKDPINFIANWLGTLLSGWGLSEPLIAVVLALLGVLVIVLIVLAIAILLVWIERKVVARFQDRLGPNRAGPFGLFQPFADIIKLIIKESILPEGAEWLVYNLAPVLTMATVLMIWAVIPFTPTVLGSDVNVGVLYIVALGSIGTLAIIMAGWASNNKYALLGAFRTVAQMVSYEVPLVITLLIPVLLSHSMGINHIVEAQEVWFFVLSPLGALLFLIASVAEIGRSPFDLLEAESEIVAGFHIEYTGMRFGLFYASELLHALTISTIAATLFLGGWRGPGVETWPILGVIYLAGKSFLLYFVVMWVRYSLPRIRIDHMLNFNWKFLTPLALTILIVTAILEKVMTGASLAVRSLVHLSGNVVIVIVTIQILRTYARIERQRFDDSRPLAVAAEPPVTTT
ncbi:MAG: NADH-quinone oxidoreductase subunit NuoH [Chloroflexota bacterium]